jgi:tellurite methyltransferase
VTGPDPVTPPLPSASLHAMFGGIDIYLFDQLLRGRLDRRRRVLDAGCGDGRNMLYLLDQGVHCFGIDRDPSAVHRIRQLAAARAPHLPPENFRVGNIDRLPWEAASMDAVLSSAVLHFADDEAHFGRMVEEMWRVLSPGGLFFARMASNIGIEGLVGTGAGRRVRLPDGSERFIVNERMLLEWTGRLGGQLLDPIKTTNVQQQRCMTTWCLEKG